MIWLFCQVELSRMLLEPHAEISVFTSPFLRSLLEILGCSHYILVLISPDRSAGVTGICKSVRHCLRVQIFCPVHHEAP